MNHSTVNKNRRGFAAGLLLLFVLLVRAATAATFIGHRTDFRDETIYFVMTTRFYDGDPENNWQCWDNQDKNAGDPAWRGDFKGLIEKLDYIKALGFTAIWITPIVQNASGYDYHGYHAMDFSHVDRRYESEDVTLETLVNAVHARGMKLVVDIVLNHTGNFGEENLCKLFDRDWTADQNKIDDCMVPFTQKDGGRLPDNYATLAGSAQYDARLVQMKDHHNNTNNDSHNYWHHFGNFNWDNETRWWAQIAGDCVDLNTENPHVANYLVRCYTNFINLGVDGFRIDTGGHIPRLTFNNNFIPQFHAAAEAAKQKRGGTPFFMFTEVCARYSSWWYRDQPALSCPFYTWKESKNYAWDYDETSWDNIRVPSDESLDFEHVNMKSCEQQYNDNKAGTQSAQPTSDNAFLNGNDYHTPDHSRFSGLSVIDFPMHHNFVNAERAWGIREGDKYYNDATYNVVYVDSHDYAPDGAPESQRFSQPQSAWAENLDLMFTFRGIPCVYYGSEIEFRKGKTIDEGTNIALRNSGRAYYGGYIKGSVETTDFGQYASATGNMAQTLSHPLAQHIRRLNLVRAAVPALRKGQYSTAGCSGTKLAFKRRYTDDTTDSYALVCISGTATFSGIPNGTYTDCITGDVKTVSDGTLSATCSGKGNMRVYVLSTAKTPAPGKIGTDGLYLYSTAAAPAATPAWDGTEEEDAENDGTGSGTIKPGGLDDLEVYEPQVADDELSVFYETDASVKSIAIWVWNNSANFTGGNWNAKPTMTLMGKTADGTRKIFKWTYDGEATSMPTGIIFIPAGSSQTADLDYVNHGYYVDAVYHHTVTNIAPPDPDAATVSASPDAGRYTDRVDVTLTASKSDAVIVYTLDGTTPTATNGQQATGSVKLALTATTTLKAGILVGGSATKVITRTYTIVSSTQQPFHAYFVAPTDWTNIYCWAWDKNNGNRNYTGGKWPGVKCTQYQQLGDGRWVWLWQYDGDLTDTPTGIIFSNNGKPQTADLTFRDGGWYDQNGDIEPLITAIRSAGNDSAIAKTAAIYDLQGRRVLDEGLRMKDESNNPSSLIPHPSSLKKGIYIVGGKKIVIK